jgi:hypothetical protein
VVASSYAQTPTPNFVQLTVCQEQVELCVSSFQS